ncbi:type II toxin-antitoxin system PemK/MazF family toxin [Mesorhizobium japonicum]|uniref:type II toxin-antitoxin system PemK/MazF family toxin n=1 Tax=Mesorhizobium japonicum TaxID=2066070 RepID=UPI003B5A5994
MKSITTNPTRGDIYDCIFGNYLPLDPSKSGGPFDKAAYNHRIPNEMRKRRPVVVLGERNNQLLVAPISSTEDVHKKPHRTGEALGLHIKLIGNEVPDNGFYTNGVDRWVKVDLIQSVDVKRLREFRMPNGSHITGRLSKETLAEVQLAVLRILGFSLKIQEVRSILFPTPQN